MDDRRFDHLARAVARRASRRGVLRGLFGTAAAAAIGGVRPRLTAAQIQPVGLGDPCYSTAQCAAQGTVYCADNGFSYDGEFNCCLPTGGRCSFDEHCCGFDVCLLGVCSAAGYAPVTYALSGDPCERSSQCQAWDPTFFCSENGFDYDGPFNCCALAEGLCNADEQCCGQLACFQGFCKDERSLPPRYR